MPDDASSTDEELWRLTFQTRVQAWASGKGLYAQLCSLEAEFPHLFALASAKAAANDEDKNWVPQEREENECKRAYRRATLLLHPDRVTMRDISVRVEAEEVLKQVTLAYAAEDDWLIAASSKKPPPLNSERSFGGSGLRDDIFKAEPPPKPIAPVGSTAASAQNPFGHVHDSDGGSSSNPFDSNPFDGSNPFDSYPPPTSPQGCAAPEIAASVPSAPGSTVLLSGYLHKKSGGKKGYSLGNLNVKWNRRWCVLHKDRSMEYSLYWYKTESDASNGPPQGAQGSVKCFESKLAAAQDGDSDACTFSIHTADRVLTLRADDIEATRAWREALLAARKRAIS